MQYANGKSTAAINISWGGDQIFLIQQIVLTRQACIMLQGVVDLLLKTCAKWTGLVSFRALVASFTKNDFKGFSGLGKKKELC